MGHKSSAEWNDASRNQAQAVGVSRRQFLTFLAATGGAAMLSACGPVGTQTPSSPVISAGSPTPSETPPSSAISTGSPTPLRVTEEPASFEGYSIFHQTMVDMPWPEIKQAAQAGAIVLLPIGVVEEHGPHMGLGADVYQAYVWSKLTRHALEVKGIKTLIAPPYYWGINVSTGAFPGSFTVRADTLKAVFYDIHASLSRWGFKYVFSLNLHGDPEHKRALMEALQKARDELGIGAYPVTFGTFAMPAFPGSPLVNPNTEVHAGANETAEMVAQFPMDVNRELAKTLEPSTGFEPWGYFGDPAKFDVLDTEEIKKWGEASGVATAEWIEAFLKKQK